MEGLLQYSAEDISAKMMRRARNLHSFRYSTDARENVRIMEEEKEQILSQHRHNLSQQNCQSTRLFSMGFHETITNINQILCSWRWIALVEYLCLEQRGVDDNANSGYGNDEPPALPAKGLLDAGVLKLLRMSSRGDSTDESSNLMDSKSTSDTLFCDVYDSPMRR